MLHSWPFRSFHRRVFSGFKIKERTHSCCFFSTVKFSRGQCSSSSDVTQPVSLPPASYIPAMLATSQRCDFQCYTYGTPFTVCMDTGADCSLLTERAYLKLQQLHNLSFLSETRTFRAVEGSSLNIIG